MIQPKISIIVPVYKTEKYLKRCLESLKKQTLKEIEIILVDDGSKDNCPKLCDEAAKEDTRIKVIHKKNAGLGMARNTGMELATGQYIGFVDSDDYVDYRMYEKLYNAAEKYNADLVMSGACFVGGNVFGKDGERVEKSYFNEDTLFETVDDIKNLRLGIVGALPRESDDSKYGVSVWKNIFKREIIEENCITFLSEREILSEDTLFMIDYTRYIKNAVGIAGAYYNYCRNEDSLSKSYNKERFEKSLVFLNTLENRLKLDFFEQDYKIYLDRLIQSYGRVLCSQEIMHARDNNIKYSILKKRLRTICTCKKITDVLKTYPWYKLPVKQAVFAFTMKYRLFWLQKLVVILRDR